MSIDTDIINIGRKMKGTDINALTTEHLKFLATGFDARHMTSATRRKSESDRRKFNMYYDKWNQETMFLSFSSAILGNRYFKLIVSMGMSAFPFIVEKLRQEPSFLVYALDKLFPGTVDYSGCKNPTDACNRWLEVLKNC